MNAAAHIVVGGMVAVFCLQPLSVGILMTVSTGFQVPGGRGFALMDVGLTTTFRIYEVSGAELGI